MGESASVVWGRPAPPLQGLAKSTLTRRACQRWPAPDFSEIGRFPLSRVGLQRLGQVDKIRPVCGAFTLSGSEARRRYVSAKCELFQTIDCFSKYCSNTAAASCGDVLVASMVSSGFSGGS